MREAHENHVDNTKLQSFSAKRLRLLNTDFPWRGQCEELVQYNEREQRQGFVFGV